MKSVPKKKDRKDIKATNINIIKPIMFIDLREPKIFDLDNKISKKTKKTIVSKIKSTVWFIRTISFSIEGIKNGKNPKNIM